MSDQVKFQSLVPVILVTDFSEAISYYETTFGFTVDFAWGEPPFYGGMSCGDVTINIRESDVVTGETRSDNDDTIDFYVRVTGIDQLSDKLKAAGMKFTAHIDTRSYGMRDFSVEDINGYRWGFGEPVG